MSNTLRTARNLGTLSAGFILRAVDFVDRTSPLDFFRFTLPSINSPINISLTGLRSGSNADIRLIRDVNDNGVVDSTDVIAVNFGFSPQKAINLRNLAGGTYFVEVSSGRFSFGGPGTNYTLRISDINPSNLIAEENNFGNLSSTPISFRGFVGLDDTSDFQRFSLASPGNINISLTDFNSGGNAELRLIRDRNGNNTIEGGEVIASSLNFPGTFQPINLANQEAGTYYVQVSLFNGTNTNYTLRLSNTNPSNLLAEELNLGNLGPTPFSINGSVDNNDTSDIYRFGLASAGSVNISLTGTSAASLRLIRDTNANGIIDDTDFILFGGTAGFPSINLANQPAGTYFAQVFQQYVNSNANYKLSLSNANPSNLIAEESFLAGFSSTGSAGATGQVSDSDTSDIYRFTVPSVRSPKVVEARLTPFTGGDVHLRLIQDTNNNGILDNGEVLGSSTITGPGFQEFISRSLGPGNYFLQAYQAFGSGNYNLSVTVPGFSGW